MTFKISTGLQSRYRLINTDHCLMFAAIGVFYEFEKWQYPDPPVGVNDNAYSRSVKSHLSLSFKHWIGEHWELTTTAIHQGKPDSYLKAARFGGAVDVAYHATPTIGIRGTYRLIYDMRPIVPVRKNYTTRVRDKFSMQIILTALTFPHIQAVPPAYSHKSNMQ